MAGPDHTQELLLLALAEPTDLPEGTVYKLRELARLPPALWRRYWRRSPEEAPLVAELCQKYAAAHPGDTQSRRARIMTAGLDTSAQLGRLMRDVGPAPTAEQLRALEDFYAGLGEGVAGLRAELGLAERAPPAPREPRPKKAPPPNPGAPKPVSHGDSRRAAQLVAAYIQAGRLEYPEEAYLWRKLRLHLSNQMAGPDGHLAAVGRALRVAFYPADRDQEEPEALVRLSRQDEPAALARLAGWAAGLLKGAPADFVWPSHGEADWLGLILQKLPLFDLLATREVCAAWEAAGRAPLERALRAQAAHAAWVRSAHCAIPAPGARRARAPGAAPLTVLVKERVVRWHREAYGTYGPHLVRYIARAAEARLGRAMARALEDVPRERPSLAEAWELLKADLLRLAGRAGEWHRALFGGPAPLEGESRGGSPSESPGESGEASPEGPEGGGGEASPEGSGGGGEGASRS